MPRLRLLSFLLAAGAALAGGCAPAFTVSRYSSNEALFQAGMRELERKRWDNAVAAFEKLTLALPARDTLLPRAHFHLGRARERKGEHLLAAQSFARLTEAFPDDTLADDALFAAGSAYSKLWRKPALDAQYGETAIATFRTMANLFPDSPLAPQAQQQVGRLQEWMALKDYENGMHYMRRKAYDSAIIYFRDVIRQYPDAATTRRAYLRLLEAYRAINYREEASEVCAAIRDRYQSDRESRAACGGAVAASAPSTTPAPPAPTPPTR